jgi:hypothetical protein
MLFLSSFSSVGCSSAGEPVGQSDQSVIGDVSSMQACPSDGSDSSCPAGSFSVICKDQHHEVDTQQQVLQNQVCMPRGPFVVSGPSGGPLYVDDDLVIFVNGKQAYSDVGHGASTRQPITLDAVPGVEVQIFFYDTFGVARGHDEVWLSGPGVPLQKLYGLAWWGNPAVQVSSFYGVGTSYPAQPNQPFDIVAFQVPAPGQTATQQCLPDLTLDRSHWNVSPNLAIHTTTTKAYDATWTVNNHEYQYTPDCNGWIGDVFFNSDQSWATVQWNTITNQLITHSVSGHPYSDAVARSATRWAVSTLFPPGDMGLLVEGQ